MEGREQRRKAPRKLEWAVEKRSVRGNRESERDREVSVCGMSIIFERQLILGPVPFFRPGAGERNWGNKLKLGQLLEKRWKKAKCHTRSGTRMGHQHDNVSKAELSDNPDKLRSESIIIDR